MIAVAATRCRFCGEEVAAPGAPRPRRKSADDDEADNTGGLIPYKNKQALLAYYCAVFSTAACVIPLAVPLSIAGIVLGLKGLKYAESHPKSRGQVHAWIGIVLGGITTVFALAMTVIIISALASQRR
jgi:hypothetical protein